ncbi:MAG: hypothetical protein A2041_04330 [Bacteroidetes bacterium GWA2_31_9b]|nr:MAG: hypothetical protein A2041_04330 [Bacteroidetes bacterium GWA2_31_9b]
MQEFELKNKLEQMRKFNDLSYNEKFLLGMAIVLLIGILFNWPKIKEGFVKGWKRYGVEMNNK